MRLIVTLFFVVLTSFTVKAQLLSYSLIRSYSFAQIDSLMVANGVPPSIIDRDYEVDAYKITYMTTHPLNGPILASGALMVPQGALCGLPMSSYGHGTVYHKDDVPSRLDQGSELVGVLFATAGYYVSQPDLIGLGDSPGMHPYIHADSEADASIDMLRASYEVLDTLSVRYSDQLFLYGYSQGGHVALATHKKIQQQFSNEFTVTASAPLSGPYDASGVQQQVITSNNPYPAPEYLPYVIFGLQDAYGNLYDSIQNVLLPPYDTLLPPMFDGTFTGGQIGAVMPSIPNQIIIPAVLDSFNQNYNHPLRAALRDQDLWEWVPTSPVRMVYCEADLHVSYMNAIVTKDTMDALGAQDIEAISAGASNDHSDCAFYAFLSAYQFFNDYRVLNNGMDLQYTITHESTPGAGDGSITTTITGTTGPYTYNWAGGPTTPDYTGLNAGVYVLTVTDALGCSETHLITIGVASSLADAANNLLEVTVFPNPATEIVEIKLNKAIEMDLFRLYDSQGRLVFQQGKTGTSQLQLHRASFDSGVYFYEVEAANTTFRGKLIWK